MNTIKESLFRNQALQAAGKLLLAYSLAVGAGLVGGVVSASGNVVLVAISAGLVMAAVVMSSSRALLWFIIIGGLVVIGAAQLYLPGSKYLRYIIPLAAMGLVLHGIVGRVNRPAESDEAGSNEILSWALFFFIVATVSAVVNWDGPGTAVMGFKGYFQMWAFLVGMLLVRWNTGFIKTIPRGIFFLAFLQLPFVLHQYLFLVPKRMGLGGGIVPVDIVSGTFGGALYGGGANAVLAAFLIVVVACLVGLWKHGALSSNKVLILSMLLLGPLLINEVKVTALYLPLVFILLFHRYVLDHPVRFMAVGGVALGLLAILMSAFTLHQSSGKVRNWSELVEFVVDRQTSGIAQRGENYNELSRWTTLTFWAKEHFPGNPVHVLIGHGPGASRVQDAGLNLADTLAEKKYGGMKIGTTAVSALLWDTGIAGLVGVLGMFFAAFRAAGHLSRYYRERDKYLSGLFDGLRAGIAVLTLSLAHKDFFAYHIPFQTLVLLVFSFVIISQRQIGYSSLDHTEKV